MLRRQRGWFVDLGLDDDGLMETSAAVTEGALVPVRVKSKCGLTRASC